MASKQTKVVRRPRKSTAAKKPAEKKIVAPEGSRTSAHAYSPRQEQEFCERAKDIGVPAAIRELGYPQSKRTAYGWIQKYGVEYEYDTLARRSAQLKTFYSQQEKLTLAHELLRSISDRMLLTRPEYIEEFDVPPEILKVLQLDGIELNRLASAFEKVTKVIELLEGRVTERREDISLSEVDIELRSLIQQMQEGNETKIARAKE